MSQLEDAGKPFIGAMMCDISVSLDYPQQFTVAKWAVKTAMVFEAIVTKHKLVQYSTEQRAALRASSTMPPYTMVWLGRFSGTNDFAQSSHTTRLSIPEKQLMIEGYVFTLVIGRLAIQVVTLHIPEEHSNGAISVRSKEGAWDRLLIQVHPAASPRASWPPIDTVSDFTALSGRYSLGRERPIPTR